MRALSKRETQFLTLAGQHRWSDDEIARAFDIATSTVHNTLRSAYQKVGVHDRRRAFARAQELGILQLGVELPISPTPVVASSAGVTDEVGDYAKTGGERRGLYGIYAGLGRFRTPKTWGGSRTAVIVFGALALIMILSMLASLISMIDRLSPYR